MPKVLSSWSAFKPACYRFVISTEGRNLKMIGVSTTVYDAVGARIFRSIELDRQKTNENLRRERRISRTATLDGGVSIYDTGYAAGDRDMTIRVPGASRTIMDWMLYIVKTYAEITVTTSESAFLAVPGIAYQDAAGAAVMIINIKEDIGG
jgi:hypothetical protein